jgi:L-ascorbate metabolism protein UlaG (beta-lactamase superfamily)
MTRNRYYAGPPSEHFDGVRFFNPGQPSTDRSLAELLHWRVGTGRAHWDRPAENKCADKPPTRADGIRIAMVGHATVLIQIAGVNLLVDPIWSKRASPLSWVGPARANKPGIAFADLPPIDAVLITHNHYDHLGLPTLRRLARAHRPRFFTPLGNEPLIAKAIGDGQTDTGDWGGAISIGGDVRVTVVPAHHWSARSIGDRRMALWCGFVIEAPAGLVYNVGDTAFGDGRIFASLGERFGPPDVAVLPIGAYEPRGFMKDQHVNPDEAVQILMACGARQGLGVHWGTFQLTNEARLAPKDALAEALRHHRIAPERFVALEPGDVWSKPG